MVFLKGNKYISQWWKWCLSSIYFGVKLLSERDQVMKNLLGVKIQKNHPPNYLVYSSKGHS